MGEKKIFKGEYFHAFAWGTVYLLSCGRASLFDRNAHYPQHGRKRTILTGNLTIFSF